MTALATAVRTSPRARDIVVVDDDSAVRQSMERLFAAAGHRVHSFESGDAFLAAGLPADADLIFLDLRMPGRDGMEVLRTLGQRTAVPPVVMLTGHGEVPIAVEAIKMGAADFVEKPSKPDELLEVFERVCSEHVTVRVREAERTAALARISELSPRQRQILQGVALGQPNKIIAFNLGLSIRTVEAYRGQLYDRLGVRSTADAVRMAVSAGLAESKQEADPA